jgi:predicted acylesterase/phospholipase RssA
MGVLVAAAYASRMDVEENPRAAIDHAWFSWRDRTLTDLTYREVFDVGFRRGAQWAVRRSGQLSPHINSFLDFFQWLSADEEGQDVWDAYVEPLPPIPAVPSSNGTGDPSDPW